MKANGSALLHYVMIISVQKLTPVIKQNTTTDHGLLNSQPCFLYTRGQF